MPVNYVATDKFPEKRQQVLFFYETASPSKQWKTVRVRNMKQKRECDCEVVEADARSDSESGDEEIEGD